MKIWILLQNLFKHFELEKKRNSAILWLLPVGVTNAPRTLPLRNQFRFTTQSLLTLNRSSQVQSKVRIFFAQEEI